MSPPQQGSTSWLWRRVCVCVCVSDSALACVCACDRKQYNSSEEKVPKKKESRKLITLDR